MANNLLEEIKQRVEELASKINAPSNLLPGFGQEIWDAHPYVEVDSLGLMYYTISERGQERERRITKDQDEILYWIFASITFSMSVSYELNHRMEGKDARRMMFNQQEELLGKISQSWKQREHAAHQKILGSYPFDDLAGLRATFSGQLRHQGFSEPDIEKQINEKYPES